jgi:ribosomal protein L40E
MKENAAFCVKCGAPAGGVKGGVPGVRVRPAAGAKDKTVAVVLAVFLGFWTWCYTYKKDAWKFWLNLGLTVVTLGFWGIVAWPWAIIETATRPREFFADFGQSVSGPVKGFPPPAAPTRLDKGPDEIFCAHCGASIKQRAVFCPKCGVRVGIAGLRVGAKSELEKGSKKYHQMGARAYTLLGGFAIIMGAIIIAAGSLAFGPYLLFFLGPLFLLGGVRHWIIGLFKKR